MVQLIEYSEKQFKAALSQADVNWKFDYIWELVKAWRLRNVSIRINKCIFFNDSSLRGLENIEIVYIDDTSHQKTQMIESPEASPCLNVRIKQEPLAAALGLGSADIVIEPLTKQQPNRLCSRTRYSRRRRVIVSDSYSLSGSAARALSRTTMC